jgi:hypothetical protein
MRLLPGRAAEQERQMRARHRLPLVLAALVAFGGCAGMTDTQQRTMTGGAAGAAGGAVIGAIAGNAGLGALIGAGAGAGGGYLYGRSKENQERAYQRGYQEGRATRPST